MSATAPVTHLLYLHGFRSSPASFKARRLADWVASHRPDLHWHCPQLAPAPAQALADLERELAAWPLAHTAVIGSSLGGFYATVLAERLQLPAVLLNPAVDPARDLAAHLGEQQGFHDPAQTFTFGLDDVAALRAMTPGELTQAPRHLAIIAKGDEVLDWREMHARYRDAKIKLLAASDHGLTDFDDHLGDVIAHLQLDPK